MGGGVGAFGEAVAVVEGGQSTCRAIVPAQPAKIVRSGGGTELAWEARSGATAAPYPYAYDY